MGVAFDPNFRQMNNGYIATMTVYSVPPQFRHFKPYPPAISSRIGIRVWRDVVPIVDDHRNFCKLEKLFFDSRRHSERFSELRHCIRSSKNRYFWQGKVEKKDINQLSIITNLLVLPIFKTLGEISPPIAYACIFDNIMVKPGKQTILHIELEENIKEINAVIVNAYQGKRYICMN